MIYDAVDMKFLWPESQIARLVCCVPYSRVLDDDVGEEDVENSWNEFERWAPFGPTTGSG